MSYDIVEITWLDAKAVNESCDLAEVGTLCIIKSVGYLVKEAANDYNSQTFVSYCVAQEVHDDGQFRDVTSIPVVNVLNFRKIGKLSEETVSNTGPALPIQ